MKPTTKKALRFLTASAGVVIVTTGLVPRLYGQESATQLPAGLDQPQSARRRLSTPSTTAITAVPEDFSKATLSPGYLLQMEVYDTPEMSTSLRVDAKGDVSVPLVGQVNVGGKTLAEAQHTIAQALIDGQILVAPEVSLNVIQFASQDVLVMGEVQNPGRVQLLAPRPLSEVLAMAGGETTTAGRFVEINHAGTDGKVATEKVVYSANDGSAGILSATIYPGDTITVQRAGAIYILGGVTRPGGYLMVNGGGLNLLEAVALAQGTTLRAAVSYAEILRPQGETYSHIKVPLEKMQKGKAEPTPLRPNDIVYIPISKFKSAVLDTGSLIGSAATSAVYAVR